MNIRNLKRSVKKSSGQPLSVGPAKGTTGRVKGPARMPSLSEVRAEQRRRAKAASSATQE